MKLEEARIVPRLQRHEAAISRWRYEGAYAFYNAKESVTAEHPDQPAGENSFVWIDGGGEVLGHVSYGPDGQIPTVEGYEYAGDVLDIGLGLRPGAGGGVCGTVRTVRTGAVWGRPVPPLGGRLQ